MTDADDQLEGAVREDEPPVRDPAFSAAVMAEVARRRFLMDVAMLSGVTPMGGRLCSGPPGRSLAPAADETGPGPGSCDGLPHPGGDRRRPPGRPRNIGHRG